MGALTNKYTNKTSTTSLHRRKMMTSAGTGVCLAAIIGLTLLAGCETAAQVKPNTPPPPAAKINEAPKTAEAMKKPEAPKPIEAPKKTEAPKPVDAPKKTEALPKLSKWNVGSLTLADVPCPVCHKKQPEMIANGTTKHTTKVTCTNCHEEHPPDGKQAIPKCSKCHSGKPHFGLDGCLGCHKDPHAPLNIVFEGELTAPCLTCHTPQRQDLEAFPSAHTSFACNFCHDVHGKKPSCMQCHEKHLSEMEFKDCVTCHSVHKPLMVTYPKEIPSHYCGACHKDQFSSLQASKTKHHNLACAFCHEDKHKTIPACLKCHQGIHPPKILAKYEKCQNCHGSPHDLKI